MVEKEPLIEFFRKNSLLNAGSSAYLEQIYDRFLEDPAAVPNEWKQYFEKLPLVDGNQQDVRHLEIQKHLKEISEEPHFSFQSHRVTGSFLGKSRVIANENKQTRVRMLIEAYRLLGHLHADIDPLKLRKKAEVPELMLSYYHLGSDDLETPFETGFLPGPPIRPLKEILSELKRIYCGTIASELMHIPDSPERIWVQQRVEEVCNEPVTDTEIKKRILECLTQAEGLERYLGTKYPGAKRFSIEGTDSLIVALDTLVQEGGANQTKEIILCMAHRGRLNILVNMLGKTPAQLFEEFEGKKHDHPLQLESGDVKYHMGFSTDVETRGGEVHFTLLYNPSHLEIVTPVACGSVRARQERRNDKERNQVFGIAIHGDAAFAGQGVNMEILNMSRTRGYGVGGTLHIITNNQIGFTISKPEDARSTLYCSDLGKMIEIPIFHVNADDPEAVYKITKLALEYKTKFKKDVIIDLVGYRRQGHNEADEPRATQPVIYHIIDNLPTAREKYAKQLIDENVITEDDATILVNQYRDALDKRNIAVAKNLVGRPKTDVSHWQPYFTHDWRKATTTAIELSVIKKLGKKLDSWPKEFVLHSRVAKIMEERAKMTMGERPIDWGYAELMAYASLLNEGCRVRLSGQDSARGTFFHRHAVLHNQKDDTLYTPLSHLSEQQAPFTIVDSLLSEAAVLAFEYGYATTESKGLIIWEAQFGDFANNAQVVIDQFISSGEQKWRRLCGLTLYLPHGYEGQGPEHSSARLERYLQLCAEHNIQVCVPSTPAQMFHMLRRQVLRPMRKPLIVLTPKSLLRHKLAVSSLSELTSGSFYPILPEVDSSLKKIRKLILCSGKIYYELLTEREKSEMKDIALIRIEQLYPFPESELCEIFKFYSGIKDIIWCQEEPENQGAWYSSQHHLKACLLKGQTLQYVGRLASASPSVGNAHIHQEQQAALVAEALK